MKETINADVQFHSQMPFTNVDVCFRSSAELNDLIEKLKQLLDQSASSDSEVTLAHPHSYQPDPEGPEPEGMPTSISFHAPGHERDDRRCLSAARFHLEILCDEKESKEVQQSPSGDRLKAPPEE